jgi:prophage antirepressor-like protein
MIRRLDEDERKLYRMSGAGREMNIIDEGALFTILIGSMKKEAAEFKQWLTKECIPGIYPAKQTTPSYGIRITIELIPQGAS